MQMQRDRKLLKAERAVGLARERLFFSTHADQQTNTRFSPPPRGDLGPLIEDIRSKLSHFYQSLPSIFHIELGRSACDNYPSETVSTIYGSRLEWLHSHFLFARFQQARGLQSGGLLDAAQQMLSLTNGFFNVRDRLPGQHETIVWRVSIFYDYCMVSAC